MKISFNLFGTEPTTVFCWFIGFKSFLKICDGRRRIFSLFDDSKLHNNKLKLKSFPKLWKFVWIWSHMRSNDKLYSICKGLCALNAQFPNFLCSHADQHKLRYIEMFVRKYFLLKVLSSHTNVNPRKGARSTCVRVSFYWVCWVIARESRIWHEHRYWCMRSSSACGNESLSQFFCFKTNGCAWWFSCFMICIEGSERSLFA